MRVKSMRAILLRSSGVSWPCWSFLASVGAVSLVPVAAAAQCSLTVSGGTNSYNCTGTQSSIVGAGESEPNGTSVTVASGAQIIVGPNSAGNGNGTGAISLKNNATVVVNGLVQSEANSGSSTYADGPNTVDVDNNSIITVNANGEIYASGTQSNAEAINPYGFGNTIMNYGTIRADHDAAIWFQDENDGSEPVNTNINTIVNEAGALIEGPSSTASVMGANGNGEVDFTNMGSVSGSLQFAGGNDVLNLYTGSSISGTINGGSGNNSMTLNGSGSDTFNANSLNLFQSVTKDGSGIWTVSGSLNDYDGSGSGTPSGELGVVVQEGTLALTGTNTNFYGSMVVEANGTLQGGAQNLMSTIADNGMVQFVNDQNPQSQSGTYTGTISGTGGVTMDGTGTLTLAPATSSLSNYSGGTFFDDGTVLVSADSDLGAATGGLTFNGGALELAQSATLAPSRQVMLNLSGGTIITDANSVVTIAQGVGGGGQLTKLGAGTLVLGEGTYGGGTDINGGTLEGDNLSFGSGNIVDNAALVINQAQSSIFPNAITGTGTFTKQGAGALILGVNTYSGGTDINSGTLVGTTQSFGTGPIADNAALVVNQAQDGTLTNAITGTGSFTKLGAGVLTVTDVQNYSGPVEIVEGTLLSDAAQSLSPNSTYTVDSEATLDLAGHNQTVAQLVNNGTVSVLGAQPGTVLTDSGNYTGTRGILRTSVELGADNSDTDKLVVGGNVSGTTTMEVTNDGGLGALTTGNGIEEVQVGGTSTKTAFALAGTHVDAGAYQYYLYEGDSNGDGSNWYLRSMAPSSTPNPTPTPAPVNIAYRTAAPLYSALVGELQQADLMMVSNFHRRVGETPAADNSMSWMRAIGGKVDVKAGGTTTPHSDGYLAGFQAGTDVYRGHGWRVGGYFGYLHGNVNVSGSAGGTYGGVGHNRMNNEYLGIYGTHTWQNNAYLDMVMQGGYERTDLSPTGASSNGLSSQSGLISAEIGKPFVLGASNWSIEPEGQVVRQWLSVNDAYISGDTVVHQRRTNGWLFRAGPRLVNNSDTRWGRLASYTRVNFYYAPNGATLTDFDTPAARTTVRASGQYASLELAAGGTLSVSRRTNLYSEIGHVWSVGGGADVKQSIEGTLGIRTNW